MEGMATLVTGGGSGIGLGCARRFAEDGAHVTIAGRTQARLAEAVQDITAAAPPGVTARYVVCDVTEEADVERAVAAAAAPTGALDVLFACAGGSVHGGPITAADVAGWRATVDLNLVGPFLCLKPAAPGLMRGGRSIVVRSAVAVH